MRSAPPLGEKRPTFVRSSRQLAALWGLGLMAACSVYTSDLVETTNGITNGGSEASGGKPGSVAGSSNSLGGKAAVDPTGGEGGDDPSANPNGGKAGAATGGTAGADPAGGGGTTGGGAAGTAGASGAGGTAGSAGTGGTTGTDGWLDDFEDNNITLARVDGRGGVWYLVGDGTTGTLTPSPLVCAPLTSEREELGGFAMHITASGFTGSGSIILGADLRDQKKVYDGSRFTGVRFWAKVGTGNKSHRVQLSDATTDAAGSLCVPKSTLQEEKCDDHFGTDMMFTTTWASYSLPFSKMAQGGWGKAGAALNKAALYGLQITAPASAKVDLWVDQIEFY